METLTGLRHIGDRRPVGEHHTVLPGTDVDYPSSFSERWRCSAKSGLSIHLRTVIDEYTYDKQKAPQTLQDLVSDGYLRQIPIDPITGNADSWRLIMEDASNTVNQTQPGIYDVRSGAEGTSLEGTAYSEW